MLAATDPLVGVALDLLELGARGLPLSFSSNVLMRLFASALVAAGTCAVVLEVTAMCSIATGSRPPRARLYANAKTRMKTA